MIPRYFKFNVKHFKTNNTLTGSQKLSGDIEGSACRPSLLGKLGNPLVVKRQRRLTICSVTQRFLRSGSPTEHYGSTQSYSLFYLEHPAPLYIRCRFCPFVTTSHHPWRKTKWMLTGGGCFRKK